jgi:hypothetical protein
MSANHNQILFFQNLKSAMPVYNSLVDEIAELLDISIDSAYRRIRGEKLLDFGELEVLSNRFNTSVDKFFNLGSNSILFKGDYNNYHDENFMNWMKDTLDPVGACQQLLRKAYLLAGKRYASIPSLLSQRTGGLLIFLLVKIHTFQ